MKHVPCEGIPVAALSRSEPTSPLERRPSLWLHGAGLSGSTWRGMTQQLPLAQTPDLPGHGRATAIDPPRVEGFARTLLPHVPDQAVLIGHSLGGMVALELAHLARERVAALVLVEAVPTVRDTRLGRMSAVIARSMMHMAPLAWLRKLSVMGQSAATRCELQRQLAQHDRPGLIAAMEAAATYDGRPLLEGISVPTLIVVGRQNRATHRGAQLAALRIPDAELVQVSGGHMLHTDNPLHLRRAIDAFLRRRL